MGSDFLSELCLDGRVQAQEVDGPDEGASGGFVARGEEGHHVVDELVLGEGAGFQRHADDVGGQVALRGESFAFRPDELAGGVSGDSRCSHNVVVALEGEEAEQPEGDEELQQADDLRGFAWLEDLAVDAVEFCIWIREGVEVLPHTREADDVEGGAGDPLADVDGEGGGLGGELGFDAVDHLAGLGPEDGVELFDLAEVEGGHEGFALVFVLVAFGEEDAAAENRTGALAEQSGLDEVVAVGR